MTDNLAAEKDYVVGDANSAFDRARHVVTLDLVQHRGCGHAMEARAMLVKPGKAGQPTTVWAATQSSHSMKRYLCGMLQIEPRMLQVISPAVGGGFGPKGMPYQEYPILVGVSLELNRPVRLDRGPP
jgi:carbon-monoxide dehydrogenase large subunit